MREKEYIEIYLSYLIPKERHVCMDWWRWAHARFKPIWPWETCRRRPTAPLRKPRVEAWRCPVALAPWSRWPGDPPWPCSWAAPRRRRSAAPPRWAPSGCCLCRCWTARCRGRLRAGWSPRRRRPGCLSSSSRTPPAAAQLTDVFEASTKR